MRRRPPLFLNISEEILALIVNDDEGGERFHPLLIRRVVEGLERLEMTVFATGSLPV